MGNLSEPLQEGTPLSEGNTGVTHAIETIGACQTVTEVLSRVGDKWSMQVVMKLGEESRRFNELRRSIEGISQRMLTRTLRALERDGLVNRKVTPSVPPRVDYSLTQLGQSLWHPVAGLGQWAVEHRECIAAARTAYDDCEDD